MNTPHTSINEKILLYILRLGLVISLFSIFAFSSRYFFPYIIPRAAFFQILIEILLVVAVILVMFFPKYRPKLSYVLGAVLLYFAIAGLSTLTAADPIKSFVGTIERAFGFYHVLHFGILFFLSAVAFQTLNEWLIFLGINVGVSLIMSGHFLIQALNSNSIPSSLMGNPTFLGAYLICNIFFAAFIISKTKNKALKITLWIAMAIFALALLKTGVRGAFVGLSASVFYLLVYGAVKYKQWRVAIVGMLIILITGYSLIFINKKSDFVDNNSILRRITNFSSNDSTVKSRFSMWKIAINGFLAEPMIGWGRENYSLVFNAHYDPFFGLSGVSEGWEDRAHNFIFDELTHGGLLGFVSYLLMIGAVGFAVRKHPVLIALLIAYMVQNLFGVDSLNSYLPLFIFLGFANFLSQEKHETIHHEDKKPSQLLAYATILATIILVYLSIATITLPVTKANKAMGQAFGAVARNDYQTFKIKYNESKNLLKYFPPVTLELISILGSAVLQNAETLSQRNAYLPYMTKIIDDLETLRRRIPLEQRWVYLLGQAYRQMSIVTKDAKYADKALRIWDELLAASPNRQLFWEAKRSSEGTKRYLLTEQGTNSKQ